MRREAEAAGALPPQPKQPRRERQGVLYSGLFGGCLAILVLAAIAVALALDDQAIPAAVFGLIAPLFIPAVVVSVRATDRRDTVLRASVALCLTVAAGGAVFDYGIPVVMSLPTLLLAQAAGLIFQQR